MTLDSVLGIDTGNDRLFAERAIDDGENFGSDVNTDLCVDGSLTQNADLLLLKNNNTNEFRKFYYSFLLKVRVRAASNS